MDKDILFAYFTKHCGEEWHASQPVPLTAWESVEALWPLNDYFQQHYKEFRVLPYLPACEQQADKALTKFAFEGEWGLLSLDTWRVLLERQQQAIMALPLHEASGGKPMVFIPPMLPKSARTGAATLVLLHSMKLPFPVGDRTAYEPGQSPPR